MSTQATSQKPNLITTIVGLAIIFAIFVFFFSLCSTSDKAENSGPETHDKLSALVMSQQFVEQRLKAPASADFGVDYEGGVKRVGGTAGHEIYTVRNYVDSENSFGAKLRMWYTCKITFNNTTANCDDLVLEE